MPRSLSLSLSLSLSGLVIILRTLLLNTLILCSPLNVRDQTAIHTQPLMELWIRFCIGDMEGQKIPN
jgi:hypothetical protein